MLRRRLQRWIPKPEAVRANPSLRWLGPLLDRPWLWQPSRRRIAGGAAIGVFFAFAIPVAQILLAAGAAVLLRVHLPTAAGLTLITNPFTAAPLYIAAYGVGVRMIGGDGDAGAAVLSGGAPALMERAADIGPPLFAGLLTFGVVGGALAWVVVHVAWIVSVKLHRRRRSARRAAASRD